MPPENKFRETGSIAAQDPFQYCTGTKLMPISDHEF
jgi:hypothetical protein